MTGPNGDIETDFAVVGAGPGGATAALCLARRGFRTVLLDASRLENERFGLTLPPEVTPMLCQLGVWDAFRRIPRIESPGIVSRWNSPEAAETDFISNPHGCGWHVDRNAFDTMLCELAGEAGANVLLGCTLSTCDRVTDGYCLRVSTGKGDRQVRCSGLLDASGRNGLAGFSARDRHLDDLLVAIVLEIETPDQHRDCRTYIEAAPHGWWYSAPSPRRTVTAMFFTGRETWSSRSIVLGEQLEACPLTAHRIGSGRILHEAPVNVPSALARKIAGPAFLAVGDSAAAYDPISGRGVFKAIAYGIAAADAAGAADAERPSLMAAYATRVESEFKGYTVERRNFYRSVQRWRVNDFWARRY